MRARIKAPNPSQPQMCCAATVAHAQTSTGKIITLTGAPELLPWHCQHCGASGEAMHYPVVGEAFQWADVDGLDIDEGDFKTGPTVNLK